MRQIEKLPQIKLISEYRGKKYFYLIFTSILFFIVTGLFIAYSGLNNMELSNILLGIVCFTAGALLFILLFKGGYYKPGKSFPFSRMEISKEKLNKYVIYASVGLLILWIIIIIFFNIRTAIRSSGYMLTGFITYYYLAKSFKFHEDIDYETNEFIVDLIGLNVDEKIVASYQNFDGTKGEKKKNDNLIVVTNRRIYFAVYNGKNWMTLNKFLSEIIKIGTASNDVNLYLKLVFSDKTSLGLRLDLYEKITTNPQLFFKQFLTTLDASLLGYDLVSNNNRRRVSISNENTSKSNNTSIQSRSIELNLTLVSELKASEEIKSGRILEI